MNTVASIVAMLGPNFRIDQDGDIEKVCTRCRRLYGEEDAWWPACSQFFNRDPDNGRGQLHSWCRACQQEQAEAYRGKAAEYAAARRARIRAQKAWQMPLPNTGYTLVIH